MPIQINTQNGGPILIDALPDRCPVCHDRIQPVEINAAWVVRDHLERILRCPGAGCGRTFITRYRETARTPSGILYSLAELFPAVIRTSDFSDIIKAVSPDFVAIFKEAESADKSGLKLVCGPGYRKALEFLIKDYVVRAHADKTDEIKKIALAKVIADYVPDGRIKEISARAVWLGNDETHYQRRWEEKDLNDLKRLITLTLHWIEMEELSKKVLADMPEGRY